MSENGSLLETTSQNMESENDRTSMNHNSMARGDRKISNLELSQRNSSNGGSADDIAEGLKSVLLPAAASLEDAASRVTQSQLILASDIERLEYEIDTFMKNHRLPADCEPQLRKIETLKARLTAVCSKMQSLQTKVDNMTQSIDKSTQRRKWQLGGFSM
eukprot:CFRG0105T1